MAPDNGISGIFAFGITGHSKTPKVEGSEGGIPSE